MSTEYIELERPIEELNAKIDALRNMTDNDVEVDIESEIAQLEKKRDKLTESIFSKLTPWQVTQLARHPKRPHTLDFIKHIPITDFDELHGDRHFADGTALITGIGRFNDKPVAVIGHQKGRSTKENIKRNFGMPRPEGYRKALRVMKLAERYDMPIFTFIDTSGAYPGVGAEERNQSEAIARNLFEMSSIKVPIIATVIGEGGSGGALAIGIADRVFMLQHSVYSVISPEGCATILWKSAEHAERAAEALGVTAPQVKELGIIDGVIPEPLGGAHRDPEAMGASIAHYLQQSLQELEELSKAALVDYRNERFLSIGISSN